MQFWHVSIIGLGYLFLTLSWSICTYIIFKLLQKLVHFSFCFLTSFDIQEVFSLVCLFLIWPPSHFWWIYYSHFEYIRTFISQEWCRTPLILALGRQRQENICEFEGCLVYKANSRTARAIQRDPVWKTNKKPTNQPTNSNRAHATVSTVSVCLHSG